MALAHETRVLYSTLEPRDRFIAFLIARSANEHGFFVLLPIPDLAKLTGYSDRTCQRALSDLESSNVLVFDSEGGPQKGLSGGRPKVGRIHTDSLEQIELSGSNFLALGGDSVTPPPLLGGDSVTPPPLSDEMTLSLKDGSHNNKVIKEGLSTEQETEEKKKKKKKEEGVPQFNVAPHQAGFLLFSGQSMTSDEFEMDKIIRSKCLDGMNRNKRAEALEVIRENGYTLDSVRRICNNPPYQRFYIANLTNALALERAESNQDPRLEPLVAYVQGKLPPDKLPPAVKEFLMGRNLRRETIDRQSRGQDLTGYIEKLLRS